MPEITDQTNIQIRYTVKDPVHGDFTDALYFSPEEFAALTPDQLDELKMQRWSNWVAAITAPPSASAAPAPQDVQVQLDALVAQQEATQAQIVAIAPPEVVVPILEQQALSLAEQMAMLNEASGRG